MKKYKTTKLLSVILFGSIMALSGCSGGDDGAAGAAGAAGPAGADGAPGAPGAPGADATADVNAESCVICHNGVGEEKHQAIYDDYKDATTLALTIDGVVSVANPAPATTFATTVTFSIAQNGAPYVDVDKLPTLDQKTFYAVAYDSATRSYSDYTGFSASTIVATGTAGQYTVAKDLPFDVNAVGFNGQIYAYIADDKLDTESGGHVIMYNDVASVAVPYGDIATYVSAANVSGCEKCHGTPYMKHGYRDPVVAGISDFSSCKSCHAETRNGGHEDWQMLVDVPERYAEIFNGDAKTAAEKTKYAYKARLMNDVHMSHAMEFPYPQSMANCATCHEGKLAITTTDANFTAETCKSCHPVTGPAGGTDAHRAPALQTIWADKGVDSFHNIDLTCNECHNAGTGTGAKTFSTLHSGYNEHIYDTAGNKYSEDISVSIDSANLVGNILTINFSADWGAAVIAGLTIEDINPTVMIGLYGYDTKHYIVGSHDRDPVTNSRLEYIPGTENPLFTTVSAAGGMWEVTADLSAYADLMATGGSVRKLEIAVMPDLATVVGAKDSRTNGETDDTAYALNAPSKTFDIVLNAFVPGYDDVVDVMGGCNTCHDALATTFHTPMRGGNIKVCKMCHLPSASGSHLEMASREIANYVHSIHSFQPFDPGDIDVTDPVAVMENAIHIEHVYPNFTIKNCESCHTEGSFDVPDQSKSLPTLHSGMDDGTIGKFVAGPANTACGACHRAKFLKEGDMAGLAAFNAHTKLNGYMVDDGDGVWASVVATIMGLFE